MRFIMELSRDEIKNENIRKTAKKLTDMMTSEEKIYQTLNSTPPIERLGINGYDWWNEGLHGVARAGLATVFPQAIGLAATWDETLAEQVADAVSTEARAKYNMQQRMDDTGRYKGLTLWAPNINIFRDPRWGRGHETYGEDPYLTSRMGIRFIEGLQGHDENYLKSAACVKHFAVHSGPEGLRHEFNAVVSKKDMYDTYLPAFKTCIQEAHVEAVMGAYNRTNGEPCCGSHTLLIDILRNEFGFKGHVVSDCFAIRDFHEHHKVTSTPEESAAMAMNNGCDLNCGHMFLHLIEALNDGLISNERLSEAVTNLYATRIKLGLSRKEIAAATDIQDNRPDNPYDNISYDVVDSPAMQKLNLHAAEKSFVLLKNKDNILPLDKTKLHTIGIIGPNANSRCALVGNYEGTPSRYYTVSEGIQDYVEKYCDNNIRIRVSDGCHLYKEGWKTNRTSEVKMICEESDVLIACMGLDASIEGEQGDAGNDYASGDKINLNLPGEQEQILKTMLDSGKPVILLLLSGSALAVNYADEHAAAIMQCWYPGAEGGRAIARVLFGDISPQGHLPVTFYRSTEELPDFTDYSMKGRTYRYMKQEALYPFGYGLSYTTYSFDNLCVSANRNIPDTTTAVISCTVTNTGKYDSFCCVQLYVKVLMDGTPNPQLKAFTNVYLKAGEQKNINIHLDKKAFCLVDDNGQDYIPDATFRIYAGQSQPDNRSCELLKQKPLSMDIHF